MATVQSMHPIPIHQESTVNDANTPTTPRLHAVSTPHKEDDAATTPTTASFAEANGKRALPQSPPPPANATLFSNSADTVMSGDSARPTSQWSNKSSGSPDVDMQSEDHDNDDSDNDESVDDEMGRPTKKKKGQRFFCTDFPPCNLSFTRSEHLARHIRKHTGERPFKCHCNRRFSRLDNLRQHAQTVHVNEEIPGDSLAATGTRFQRQIRTDRVRPAGTRSRASTTSSQASHHRGHGRNLSTSSIASNTSTISTISAFSQDPRMHPHPLMMAPDHRQPAGLTIDTMRVSPQHSYTHSASGDPATTTGPNYSAGPASPYGSTVGSPIASSRFQTWDARHGRRLSVPNGSSPFQPGHQYIAPMSPGSGFMSNNSSALASPTSSVFSSRQDLTPAEADSRRRTWHPSTYSGYSYQRPATSGLSYSQTPDAPRPAFAPQAAAAASQPVRLPGFNDLVNQINRPSTPPSQIANQQTTESPARPPPASAHSSSDRGLAVPAERSGHRSWDATLQHNLNKLDIASGTPPRESSGWSQQVLADMNSATASLHGPPSYHHPNIDPRLQAPPQPQFQPHPQQQFVPGPPLQPASVTQQQMPQDMEPSSPTASRNRRTGWYNGPIAPAPQVIMTQQHQRQQQRISPASSSSDGVDTPMNPSFEHHPTIVHANGYVEPAKPVQPASAAPSANAIAYQSVAPKPDSQPLTGLDALVAAATSESQARDARR